MHRYYAAKRTAAYKYAYHCCGYCHAKKWVTRMHWSTLFLPPPFSPLLGEETLQANVDLEQSQTYHQLAFVSRHPKDMNDIEKRHSQYVGT